VAGTPFTDAVAALEPNSFVPTNVNPYVKLLVKPVTVIGLYGAVAVFLYDSVHSPELASSPAKADPVSTS
jgi:hypothetical protein